MYIILSFKVVKYITIVADDFMQDVIILSMFVLLFFLSMTTIESEFKPVIPKLVLDISFFFIYLPLVHDKLYFYWCHKLTIFKH